MFLLTINCPSGYECWTDSAQYSKCVGHGSTRDEAIGNAVRALVAAHREVVIEGVDCDLPVNRK